MFQRVGSVAFKSDLTNTLALCQALGNPQDKFKPIHIGGTNGKGSTSHMIAAVLQSAGYKTGLYTSPHLKEFTERIRIDGKEITKDFVVDFVERIKPLINELSPSFFEITVVMAFDYFARQQVDVAVIEVGLGGRLDSTNVIKPLLSLITNISWDHQDLLGDTLEKIATEKAGIIKSNTPVIISERQIEVEKVFTDKANECTSHITFASDHYKADRISSGVYSVIHENKSVVFHLDLSGRYQVKNLVGVLAAIEHLHHVGFEISQPAILAGLSNVVTLTGLKGRWQMIGEHPLMICDTGHNEAGIREVIQQINEVPHNHLHIVLGMVKDKDISRVLQWLPAKATYYFCAASIPRALPAIELQKQAQVYGLAGDSYNDVNDAIHHARQASAPDDFIFIGGSTFVVAEVKDL
jgi:dihydrofolate synthase / folylpolyglutamate synthase